MSESISRKRWKQRRSNLLDISQLSPEFKPDWEAAAARHLAFWQRAVIDRVALQVYAPKDGATNSDRPAPPTLEERWTNIDYKMECTEERLAGAYYGGESLPIYWPNLGPDVFTGYLGCELIFGERTSWSVPLLKEWGDKELRFDPSNHWWQLTLKMTAAAVERSAGRYLVGLTDLHGGMDAAAALRDPQQLALDLLDSPDKVHELMRFLTPVWFEIYEGQRRVLREKIPGTTSWLSTWSPGRWYPVSCDFACMVSTRMFEEFILPDIEAEVNWLDHSLFHLDGPGAIRHLDALLALEKLDGIQWVPGAGSPGMLHWIPLLKRVQAAGKCLHLWVNAKEVETLLAELRPEGLMLATQCANQEEAEELLKKAKQWTRSN